MILFCNRNILKNDKLVKNKGGKNKVVKIWC